ncbi:hypothetical protein CAOG_03409 [Capsaspora owczarzaki ATCC 30864]|uniref:Uncharacterized protein n=1 Tax=Capsaspora owczarzaki (strain ATCC 30864) TaxID=595528 RepID=A0A0D2WP87_CAPO3|nr:hypothetical protein CAOG_03409 [Capsaspora owczarzaki ATCC 30864]KJE92433.1 hypothetical protein CAOG_003409 [Capsaspora owczarzaki ATCC 30864]|eukprot:XP_004364248.1 hypothetical protein CAOG_03409 [Capsaspora owczarzaki ATCC 30864]
MTACFQNTYYPTISTLPNTQLVTERVSDAQIQFKAVGGPGNKGRIVWGTAANSERAYIEMNFEGEPADHTTSGIHFYTGDVWGGPVKNAMSITSWYDVVHRGWTYLGYADIYTSFPQKEFIWTGTLPGYVNTVQFVATLDDTWYDPSLVVRFGGLYTSATDGYAKTMLRDNSSEYWIAFVRKDGPYWNLYVCTGPSATDAVGMPYSVVLTFARWLPTIDEAKPRAYIPVPPNQGINKRPQTDKPKEDEWTLAEQAADFGLDALTLSNQTPHHRSHEVERTQSVPGHASLGGTTSAAAAAAGVQATTATTPAAGLSTSSSPFAPAAASAAAPAAPAASASLPPAPQVASAGMHSSPPVRSEAANRSRQDQPSITEHQLIVPTDRQGRAGRYYGAEDPLAVVSSSLGQGTPK